jgi:hypothetical protein
MCPTALAAREVWHAYNLGPQWADQKAGDLKCLFIARGALLRVDTEDLDDPIVQAALGSTMMGWINVLDVFGGEWWRMHH